MVLTLPSRAFSTKEYRLIYLARTKIQVATVILSSFKFIFSTRCNPGSLTYQQYPLKSKTNCHVYASKPDPDKI